MLRHNGSPEIRRCPLRLFEATLGEQFDTLGTTLLLKAYLKGIPFTLFLRFNAACSSCCLQLEGLPFPRALRSPYG